MHGRNFAQSNVCRDRVVERNRKLGWAAINLDYDLRWQLVLDLAKRNYYAASNKRNNPCSYVSRYYRKMYVNKRKMILRHAKPTV